MTMEGFLKPYIPELKIKDYKTYHAFRCGMCNRLFSDYGPLARFLVSGDTILFALLCDSTAGREGTCKRRRCPYNSFHRCTILSQTKGIQLAARMQIILTWHQLNNQLQREENVFTKLKCHATKLLLLKGHKKALVDGGATVECLVEQAREHGAAVALTKCTNYDIASEAYGNIFSGLFVQCASDDSSWKSLQQFGYYLGRIYFFIHSVAWYDCDKKQGRYNVFLQNGLTKEVAIETAKHQCNLAAVELARATTLLNMQLNRTLLDNIIYLGLEHAVAEIGQKPTTSIWMYK